MPRPTTRLEEAVSIAVRAHAGQKDKAGDPYILHPIRVMLSLDGDEERIVGILHDVVEDTPWTLARLRARGFEPRIVSAIDSVTRREGEAYDAFVRRSAANPIGRRVKLADLLDNFDRSRALGDSKSNRERRERYRRAIGTLRRLGVRVPRRPRPGGGKPRRPRPA